MSVLIRFHPKITKFDFKVNLGKRIFLAQNLRGHVQMYPYFTFVPLFYHFWAIFGQKVGPEWLGINYGLITEGVGFLNAKIDCVTF